MANPIYARLQATAQRLIAKYGPGVARRWGQAPGLSPPRPPPGRLRAALTQCGCGLYSPIRAKPNATIRDRAVSAAAFEILNSRVCEFERSEAGPLLSSREKGLSASKSKRPAIRAGVTFHGVPSRLWVGRQMLFCSDSPKSSLSRINRNPPVPIRKASTPVRLRRWSLRAVEKGTIFTT